MDDKTMDWSLYDRDLCHEGLNEVIAAEVYLGHYQTSMMEFYVKILNGF